MHLILMGIIACFGCYLMGEYGAGVICITIGSCLQHVVNELEEIKNKLK